MDQLTAIDTILFWLILTIFILIALINIGYSIALYRVPVESRKEHKKYGWLRRMRWMAQGGQERRSGHSDGDVLKVVMWISCVQLIVAVGALAVTLSQ